MPKLKQPDSLESTVMNYLVEFVFQLYEDLEINGPSERVLRGISDIKYNVRNQMPGPILTEFIHRFQQRVISKLYHEGWMKSTFRASMEMLMDVQIIGLECSNTIIKYLHRKDLRRLKGLAKIDLYHDRCRLPKLLKHCRLNDITLLALYRQCEDKYLKIIGKNCSKLQVLNISDTNITDKGLRALRACKELRSIDIFDCEEVSHVGINDLLTVHDKLEVLAYGQVNVSVDHCHFLSRMSKPCLTMKHFWIRTKVVSYRNLCLIAAMFPNLTTLGLCCKPIRDFSVLKSLSHLSVICLEVYGCHYARDHQSVWESLQELFKVIGKNITGLTFRSFNERCGMDRRGLKFLYDHCPNIESLECDVNVYMSTLVVPPFPKLKVLQLEAHGGGVAFDVNQFGTMLNLEVLKLVMISLSLDNLRSMVLDDEKFPKLKRFESTCPQDEDEINSLAKQNNLDFKMELFHQRSM